MTTITMDTPENNNWYQQPWVWFIIGLLVITMLASFAMLAVAIKNAPDLVVENYSNIDELTNKTRAQDQQAVALDLRATVEVSGSDITVTMTGNEAEPWPVAIMVRTQNSTVAALDSRTELSGAGGIYSGTLALPENAYDLHIEDPARTWRLSTRMYGRPASTRLEAFRPGQ